MDHNSLFVIQHSRKLVFFVLFFFWGGGVALGFIVFRVSGIIGHGYFSVFSLMGRAISG